MNADTAPGHVSMEPRGPGFVLHGDLTFATVRVLWADGAERLRARDWPEVGLDGVGRADSAGLALLVEWARMAGADGRRLRLRAVPEQLHALAAASHVQELIGLSERE